MMGWFMTGKSLLKVTASSFSAG